MIVAPKKYTKGIQNTLRFLWPGGMNVYFIYFKPLHVKHVKIFRFLDTRSSETKTNFLFCNYKEMKFF